MSQTKLNIVEHHSTPILFFVYSGQSHYALLKVALCEMAIMSYLFRVKKQQIIQESNIS